MKKILLLVPALVLVLTGCSAMGDMEEAYAEFKENTESGYVVTENISDAVIVLDYSSATDYTVDFENSDFSYSLVCTGDETSTFDMTDFETQTGDMAITQCDTMLEAVTEDVYNHLEQESYYDSSYDIDYSKTDDGFEATGLYVDGTEHSLTINEDKTIAIFKDDSKSISMEVK